MRGCGPGGEPGRKGSSTWQAEKPAAGVQPDEGPYRLGDAQPLACPPGRCGQNGQGVAQQVAGAGQLVERVNVESDEFLCAALPELSELVEMSAVSPAAQPAAHGGWRAAQRGGDAPVSHARGLASQRGADHLGGVGPAWLQRGRQQDLGGCASAAAHPSRAHLHRVAVMAAHAPAAPYPHRVRLPPHPRQGQPICPSASACSAHSAVRRMIIRAL